MYLIFIRCLISRQVLGLNVQVPLRQFLHVTVENSGKIRVKRKRTGNVHCTQNYNSEFGGMLDVGRYRNDKHAMIRFVNRLFDSCTLRLVWKLV